VNLIGSLPHGGGSFGHPVAKEYDIYNGINPDVENQIFGLAKTHEVMTQLNSHITKEFLDLNYPAISIQPSSIFNKVNGNISVITTSNIEYLLNLNVLPILYGDIIIDNNNSFSILSGDQIIVKLCSTLKNFVVKKVIFAIEKDGIFIKDPDRPEFPKLISKIGLDQLGKIQLADLENKIDITGGIEGKIENIKEIIQLNIPVQIINGLKSDFLYKALKNIYVKSTNIY
jgi:isopentenyl phosphate kinase